MAISEERKMQLLGLVKQLKAGKAASPLGTAERAKKAGIFGGVDTSTMGKLHGAQIAETAPSEERAVESARTAREFATPFIEEGKSRIAGATFAPSGTTVRFEPGREEELEAEKQRGLLGEQAKLAEGQRAAERSLSVVSTTLNDFSKVLVGAYDEGGFGDIIKASKSALKQRFAGGLATQELVETGKIPGKKVEIITKMMPLLTQQGDKPGSVRLVSTVFERLADSLPGANRRADVKGNDISLQESRGMMEETMKSMLRFAQAIQSLGITNESIEQVAGKVGPDGKPEKGSELSKLGDLIERVSTQFYQEGSPEEEQINSFIAQALAPLDERIARLGTEGQEETSALGLTPEEEEELRLIDEELGRL